MASPPSSSPPPPPPKPTEPFRFKHPSSTSHNSTTDRPHKRRRHHHHHHRSRRPHTLPSSSSSAYPPQTAWDIPPDPDTAFRESLFDALADDEGALFWEGVYGQPIHQYSPWVKSSQTSPDISDDINGEPKLERMSDEEYVAYVRSKMWEKSHEYIFEERARREGERQRRRKGERERERGRQAREWECGVEEALRRGEERRREKRWRGVWESYVKAWEKRREDGGGKGVEGEKKEGVWWPVESGKREDVGKEEVERFYGHAPQAAKGENGEALELVEVLKRERVKWHPDKMQQRAGEAGLDKETMKLVTAVFQVVDRLWNELKGKS